jgi:aspartate aminotransferase
MISKRADNMPYSPIRKLSPFAEIAKKRGIHVYHLNIGQPDIHTPAEFYNAIRTYDNPVLGYGPSNGLPEYRAVLQRYYKSYGIEVSDEQIFVTVAGSEALLFALFAVTDSGDNVLTMEPFYTNYNGFCAMADVSVTGIPTRPEDGFQIPPVEEFRKRLTSRTKAILVCNPNNPTGAVYSGEALQALAEFAREHNLFFISDEVYREFTYDGHKQVSVLHLKDMEEHAVMVDSVSKRYSACGARIGCMVTRNAKVLDAVMRMGQARLCPPTLEQIGSMASLEVPEEKMQSIVSEYQTRRDVLHEGLNSIDGVFCEKPYGAFYMMATLPVDDSDAFARFLLEQFDYRGRTVMVAPGSGFYATKGCGGNQVRVAYVLKKDDLTAAVETLERALKIY